LQFGAELYGCSNIAADIEILLLALDALQTTQTQPENGMVVDLADARIVPALLAQAPEVKVDVHRLQQALITKNAGALRHETASLPAAIQQALHRLPDLYGTVDVLDAARQYLPALPEITQALNELAALAAHIASVHPALRVQFDLADSQGYSYYSGMHFAVYLPGGSDAMVRGGRYDEVGAAFGRMRPAVGFSLDVKALAQHVAPRSKRPAIRATWQASADWQEAVQALRRTGETVVVTLPGQEHAPEELVCDRALIQLDGRWVVQAA
jgi:ATP phosphoribosyltransferase regulatory subunit